MSVNYIDRRLTLIQNQKQVDLFSLAQKIGEPFYLYDIDGACHRLKIFQEAVHPAEVFFSLKSNSHAPLVQSFLKKDAGLDIVSGGELSLSLDLHCPPEKIVFSGVGKTKQELEQAIENQIFQINVESLQELERIGKLCHTLQKKAKVAIRINPNIQLDTHPFIQTGTGDHKFGIEENLLPQFLEIIKKYSSKLQFQGLAMHIGSQGLSIEPLIQAAKKIKNIYEDLCRQGFQLQTIDIGGGVGIDYRNQDVDSDLEKIQSYGLEIKKIFQKFSGKVICEPGRILVARFGYLMGEVQYIKKTSLRQFVILNTGMSHLIRPVLYQAFHHILPLILSDGEKKVYTIAGPICESADVLARDRLLPQIKQGDWMAFKDAGAYGAVMASKYNLQNFPKEVAFLSGQQIK